MISFSRGGGTPPLFEIKITHKKNLQPFHFKFSINNYTLTENLTSKSGHLKPL